MLFRSEFRKEIKDSGFVDVFPVLYQAAEVPKQGWLPVSTHKIMTEDHNTSYWPDLVSLSKYPTYASRSRNKPTHPDHKHALRALVASCTKNMTKFVETDVTVL